MHGHLKQTKRTTNKKDWFIPLFILYVSPTDKPKLETIGECARPDNSLAQVCEE